MRRGIAVWAVHHWGALCSGGGGGGGSPGVHGGPHSPYPIRAVPADEASKAPSPLGVPKGGK